MGRTLTVFTAYLVTVACLEAVTVNPSLCPTNKIAPHKRISSLGYGTGRTLGAFFDLLTPGDFSNQAPNYDDLQEQPQADDPSDCGEIEDYDENDLSAITPQGNRRQDRRNSRWFDFGAQRPPSYPTRPPNYPTRPPNYPERPTTYPQRPPNYPERPTTYPQRPPNYPERPTNYPQRPPNYPERPPNYPQRPPNYPDRPSYYPQRPPGPPLYPSTRPPYWSGGFFGSNAYRPPLQLNPSDNIKPIHEYSESSEVTYRPDIVGGPLGHVVGVSPAIPTVQDETTTTRTFFNRLRTSTARSTPNRTRRPRARHMNNESILGSFVDLLFK